MCYAPGIVNTAENKTDRLVSVGLFLPSLGTPHRKPICDQKAALWAWNQTKGGYMWDLSWLGVSYPDSPRRHTCPNVGLRPFTWPNLRWANSRAMNCVYSGSFRGSWKKCMETWDESLSWEWEWQNPSRWTQTSRPFHLAASPGILKS